MIRKLIGIGLAVFTIVATTACSPVSTSGKGAEESNDTPVDDSPVTPPTAIAPGSESYFKMSMSEGPVVRSSTLKFESGNCSLSNLYDFPDDIFGDNSLDNLTTTPLDKTACRRLAIAESIRTASGGSCAPSSLALSAADKAQIGVDPAKYGLTGVTASELNDLASTIELTADCVCAVSSALPSGGLIVSASVPPTLGLCTQKFPAEYSSTNLANALSQINMLYGIP